MDGQRILITGACGRIGRILEGSLANSFDIRGLDIVSAPSDPHKLVADIVDLEELEGVFRAFSPLTYVIHLAADPRHDADWHSVFKTNIHGTHNVFEGARRFDVKRVVFASSIHVTGAFERDPPTLHMQADRSLISVKDDLRPDGFYGISKIAGEAIARYYFDYHGIEAVCLRIGSVLEPDDPTKNERLLSTWLSHRDLIQLVGNALTADERFPGFGIYYGVSNNTRRLWDISNAEMELGYIPEDDASSFV